MNNTQAIYSAPTANVEIKEKEFSFFTLGIWRKIYLIMLWLVVLLSSSAVFMSTFVDVGQKSKGNPIVSIVFILLCFGYGYWVHSSVVKRNVFQLRLLCFLQIIPLMNPVSALIMWAIGSTSKKEIEAEKTK